MFTAFLLHKGNEGNEGFCWGLTALVNQTEREPSSAWQQVGRGRLHRQFPPLAKFLAAANRDGSRSVESWALINVISGINCNEF